MTNNTKWKRRKLRDLVIGFKQNQPFYEEQWCADGKGLLMKFALIRPTKCCNIR